ncbi:MAG: hypothetical protein JOY99_17385 [Sphingomonadaceae bacterium]|nr:hypothetical protein [Sphingomonadaceae bacterium]
MFDTLHFIADRAAVDGAVELIGLFGEEARGEAARRAEQSRRIGNHIHFTRWRRVERMLDVLTQAGDDATRH